MDSEYKICSRCIFDSRIPGIHFDGDGVCNYCHQIEELERVYQTGNPEGEKKLQSLIKHIKADGKNKKFDCVIGVSGGTDSSYLLLKAKEWGLRPLAVHYDNTWNSAIATENIRKVTNKLNINLYTYVIDNKESDDIYKAFLKAGVPEFDASTDIAFAQVLRKAAAKYRIRYILEGHSFKAEGVSPMGKNYFDGKYIKSVHKKFGSTKLKTYPNLTFFQFLKWIIIYRQKFIRPLWYINYSKSEAQKILERTTGWQYYGGHHHENLFTKFFQSYYLPKKFNIDKRKIELSALIRTGQISRESALLETKSTHYEYDSETIKYALNKLEISESEWNRILNAPAKTHKDFKTLLPLIRFLRVPIKIATKLKLIPSILYLKYARK